MGRHPDPLGTEERPGVGPQPLMPTWRASWQNVRQASSSVALSANPHGGVQLVPAPRSCRQARRRGRRTSPPPTLTPGAPRLSRSMPRSVASFVIEVKTGTQSPSGTGWSQWVRACTPHRRRCHRGPCPAGPWRMLDVDAPGRPSAAEDAVEHPSGVQGADRVVHAHADRYRVRSIDRREVVRSGDVGRPRDQRPQPARTSMDVARRVTTSGRHFRAGTAPGPPTRRRGGPGARDPGARDSSSWR